MTVEDFHDALTLLPADLVAQSDKRRSRKPRLVLWHRWAAMAACLALVLSCGLLVQSWKPGKSSGPNLMAAPAVSAEAAPAEADPALTNDAAAQDEMSLGSGMSAAGITEKSRADAADAGTVPAGILDITCVETPMKGDSAVSISGEPKVTLISSREMLEDYLTGCGNQNGEALKECTEGFDEDWFAAHDLWMLRLTCSADAAVTDICQKDGRWEIHVEEKSPESPAGGSHILITAEKGLAEDADHITLFYTLP